MFHSLSRELISPQTEIIHVLTAHCDNVPYPQGLLLVLHTPGNQEHGTIVKSKQEDKYKKPSLIFGIECLSKLRGEMNLLLMAFLFQIVLNRSSWAETAFSKFMRDFYSCHI